MTQLVLASASPARLATLRSAGLKPTVLVSGVDESTVDFTDARTLCAELARLKAQAVVARIQAQPSTVDGPALVLGCDSVLEFDGQVYGKPSDASDATRRWQAMRGHTGMLHTGHCLVNLDTGATADEVGSTAVRFAELSDDEIDAYVATGEPLYVAGAFTIDGLGGFFVESIDGDASNVVGVSLPLLRRLIARLGYSVADLWRTASAVPADTSET